MKTIRSSSCVVILSAFLAACATSTRPAATEIVVAITTDLAVETELSRLEIQVSTRDGSAVKSLQDFTLVNQSPQPGQLTLPVTFAIEKTREESCLLVVSGYGPPSAGGLGAKIVEQRFVATFQDGKSLLLQVFLGRACVNQLCTAAAGTQVCYPSDLGMVKAGDCGRTPVLGSGDLETVAGGKLPALVLPPAGGKPEDGGPSDSAANVEVADAEQAGHGDSGETASAQCAPGSAALPCSERPDGTPITWPGGAPQGKCAFGKKTCDEQGSFGACEGAVAPAPVDCTSSDDNSCTGASDNTKCNGCVKADGTPARFGDTDTCFDFPLPAKAGLGVCAAGTKSCIATADGTNTMWDACIGSAGPKSRDCSSALDNDCNGAVDNTECGTCVAGTTASCYDGPAATRQVGSCHDGTKTCVLSAGKTTWGPCGGPQVLPKAADSCARGNDDNCDGHDKSGCSCYQGDTQSCAAALSAKGTCASGTSTCASGSWGGCSISPAAQDTCANGNDDNCNGVANNACSCLEGVTTQSCGVSGTNCTLGSQTCVNGHANTYGACSGNTCANFTVSVGVDMACGPNCCDGTTCDWSNAACGAGYHVTGCSVTNTGGKGTCSYDGASGGTAYWHGQVGGTDGTHCVLSSCTCRRDGF